MSIISFIHINERKGLSEVKMNNLFLKSFLIIFFYTFPGEAITLTYKYENIATQHDNIYLGWKMNELTSKID